MRYLTGINITQVRKILAKEFPDVEFTYESNVGRGHHRGNGISWTGGPHAHVVQAVIPLSTVKHFQRHHTPEELEVLHARWDREAAEREAAEPALRAARKAAGLAKARATRERKASLTATLTSLYPGVTFAIEVTQYGTTRFTWVDGPEIAEICKSMTVSQYACTRTESPEHVAMRETRKREQMIAARLARRLARSKDRPAIVMRAIRRREVAYSEHNCTRNHESRQLSLFMQPA